MVKERRCLERFDLHLKAQVEMAGYGCISLTTADISSGGAFFPTDSPLPDRSKVTVRVLFEVDELRRLLGRGRVALRLAGRVLRSGAGGMAVAFDGLYEQVLLES